MKKMAADGKNVYLVNLGPKSLADGCQDICKLATKAEIIQSFACETEDFVISTMGEFLFLFTFGGNIQCAKKVLRLASTMD